MKKILSLGLAFAMFIFLTGCGINESAESVIEKAIISVKNMDFEAMKQYWGKEQFKDVEEATEGIDEESYALMSILAKNLDYQIIEANEEKNTSLVKVQFTNIDMNSIISEFISESFKLALSNAFLPEGEQPTQEEIDKKHVELMAALMEREENPKVTNTVEISLSLIDNTWVINQNKEAIDAMFGGIGSLSDSMSMAFNESFETSAKNEISQMGEIRNWVVTEIWNKGFCDLSWYYSLGTSSTGENIDPELTLQQLNKAMQKKLGYDDFMVNLPAEYSEISELWKSVSSEIDVLYEDVKSRELAVSGKGLDTAQYDQCFRAFDKAYSEICENELSYLVMENYWSL